MKRHGKYTLEEVFNWALKDPDSPETVIDEFEGLQVLSNLMNYIVFEKCQVCATCDHVGLFFALEKTPGPHMRSKYNNWHFNMYAINEDGREVLMTKDHILARSNGGKDDLSNYQTMCSRCNTRKGNKSMEEFTKKKENGKKEDKENDTRRDVIKEAQRK